MCVKRMFQNEKGSGSMVLLVTLAMAGVIYLFTTTAGSSNLLSANRVYVNGQDRKQLEHEVGVVLGNPGLCTQLLTIDGNQFKIGTLIEPGAVWNSKYIIQSTEIASLGPQPNGKELFRFRVSVANAGNPNATAFTAQTHGSFDQSGGVVTNCAVAIQPQQACEAMGLTWNETSNRCSLCEAMGGTWTSSNSCELT